MTEHNVYELSDLAGVNNPDSFDSPGANWLRQVASDIAEAIEYDRAAVDDNTIGDMISERADAVVPVYTHERWQVFVDLCAYNFKADEGLSEGVKDMTEQAGVILYQVAEALMWAVWQADYQGQDA